MEKQAFGTTVFIVMIKEIEFVQFGFIKEAQIAAV
jgi:hypothetical protein